MKGMNEILTIEDAIQFIYSFINYEIHRNTKYNSEHYNLGFMKTFLEYTGHPEKDFMIIHVAGTNGKGSVVNLLSYLLCKKGYRVGLYTSPHLIRINERICVDHHPIRDVDFVMIVNKLRIILENIAIRPTYFEAVTAMALLYFQYLQCEYVVLEVGMGGRLDSTNFPCNKLTIINTISFDHTEHLGKTLLEIGKEKGGIVQEGNPLILGKINRNLHIYFEELTERMDSSFYRFGVDFKGCQIKRSEGGVGFDYYEKDRLVYKIFLGKISIYSVINISLVLFALRYLGIEFTQGELDIYLKNFSIPGRFDIIEVERNTVVLDVAHNVESMKSLMMNLRLWFRNRKKYLIMGFVEGKDYKNMIYRIHNQFEKIVICKLPVEIKKDISLDIFEYLKELRDVVYYGETFIKSFNLIKDFINAGDILVVTGSFSLVGAVYEHLEYNKLW